MRILVVEDEKKIATFIQRGLREEGYSVDVALNGDQADELAVVNDYDLILLDLMLPRIGGLELCRRFRRQKIRAPILMLTARDGVPDKVAGLDAGADDYLTKPFAFEELLARARALLRRKNDTPGALYQVGDLVVDLIAHRAERGKKPLDLTPKEFALLEYLMRHSGEVVTRTMLSEHVWGLHFDVSSNVIDVYVNYLRNKVDKGHPKKLIHTIRGRGYVIKG